MGETLAPDVRAVLTRFVYDMWNATLAYPLLKGIDYRTILLEAPSSAEQMIAVFLNVLDVDDAGLVTNADAARLRAQQYLREYCDPAYTAEPPFEQSELKRHPYNRKSLGPMP